MHCREEDRPWRSTDSSEETVTWTFPINTWRSSWRMTPSWSRFDRFASTDVFWLKSSLFTCFLIFIGLFSLTFRTTPAVNCSRENWKRSWITLLQKLVGDHQTRRAAVTDETVELFMSRRKLKFDYWESTYYDEIFPAGSLLYGWKICHGLCSIFHTSLYVGMTLALYRRYFYLLF